MKIGVEGDVRKQRTRLYVIALSMAACSALPACAEEKSETAPCTVKNFRVCEPPSAEARSAAWPELREQLGKLADETTRATSDPDPERWHMRISTVRAPDESKFFLGWNDVVQLEDKSVRGAASTDAYVNFVGLFGTLSDLYVSRAPLIQGEAVDRVAKARGSFELLKGENLYRDPFGQPEPRRLLFQYALAATTMQFLEKPAGRRAIATQASDFLNARLAEWADMQRARLAGKSTAEVDAAIESIGVPEIRRLTAAWQGIENLTLTPVGQ